MSKKKEVEIVPALAVEKGTAQIEPQFVVNRFLKPFVKAQNFKDLIVALKRAMDSEEQEVNVSEFVKGFPFDCLRAMQMAMEQIFGWSKAVGGFFNPPVLSIQTGIDQTENVTFGSFQPPQLEGGTIQIGFHDYDSIHISANIKRKFEPAFREVVTLARKLAKEQSIYRGKAVQLDLSYLEAGDNWFNHQPTFIDNSKEVDLVLPRVTEFELETSVWGLLRNTEAFRKNGIPVKHGLLLKGTFGTGKTLISYRTSQIAGENGWSYIYLKTPSQFVAAHRLAQFIAPVVLFVEDVDAIAGGNRDAEMNQILETLDGVAAKGQEVITVFTTNFPEKINPAFMRSGRMDTQIELTPFDADAAARFVKLVEHGCLELEADYEAIGEAFAGLVPADITEGINKAKRAAIAVTGRDIDHAVSTDQMVSAGQFMQKQKGVKHEVNEAEEKLETIRQAFAITREGVENRLAPKSKARFA